MISATTVARRADLVELGLRGMDDVGRHHAAGAVHHGELAAGAEAGIEPHHRHLAQGGLEEEGLEVGAEHGDRLGLGALAHLGTDLVGDRGAEQALVAVRRGLGDLAPAGGVEREAPGAAQALDLALVVDPQIGDQEPLALAAQDGEQAVGGDVPARLVVLEVVAVGGGLGVLLLLGEDAHAQQPLGRQHAAELGALGGALGQALGQDVAGAGEGGRGVLHPLAGVDEGGRQLLRQVARGGAGEEGVGQRLQPLLAGDLGAGAPLGLVGEVEVLEVLLGHGGADRGLQLVRELPLLADALQDGVAALGELQEVLPALEEGLELQVLEAARGLLAVAGHEGDGRPLGEQLGGGPRLVRPAVHLRGDDLDEAGFQDGGLAHSGISPSGRRSLPQTLTPGPSPDPSRPPSPGEGNRPPRTSHKGFSPSSPGAGGERGREKRVGVMRAGNLPPRSALC